MKRIVGFILLIVGIALFFYPKFEYLLYHQDEQKMIESFEQLGQTDLLEKMSTDQEDVYLISRDGNTTAGVSEQEQILDGASGIIRIKSINLEMILFDGASAKNLGKGAAIVEPDKVFGINNVGIAGHRALAKGKQFNRLDELKQKDVIEVTTREGVFQFKVVKTFVVHESQVSVLDESETPLITLITCTPVGVKNPNKRLIVQAELVKEVSAQVMN